jgi:hypothetical protein
LEKKGEAHARVLLGFNLEDWAEERFWKGERNGEPTQLMLPTRHTQEAGRLIARSGIEHVVT